MKLETHTFKFAPLMIRTVAMVLLTLVGTRSSAQHIFHLPDACTYYGHAADDLGRAIIIDASGDVVIAGNTNSSVLAGTDSSSGSWDIFIAKFDASLQNLLAATLIGGSSADLLYDMVLDSSGRIVISGTTASSDFPLTFGAYKTSLTSPTEIFITKLNSALTVIEASTLVGPTISDISYGRVSLAIDSAQSVFIAGSTEDTTYPATAGAFDLDHNAGADAVISKLSNDLSTLLASTFLGDSANDHALALAVDDGQVFVGGRTSSTGFPVTTTDTLAPFGDAFISVLTDDLQLLEDSRFFGGAKGDEVTALSADGVGGLYAAGNTYSDTLFASGFQDSLAGSQDAFMIHLSSALSVQSQTYLGGSSFDAVDALILGDDNLVYVCGQTQSSDFPKTWQGFDQVREDDEGFISAFSLDLTTMQAGGFLGGDFGDRVLDLVQVASSIYFTGWTQADTFWQTPLAFDTLWNGNADAFVLRTGSLTSTIADAPSLLLDAQVRTDRLWINLPQPSEITLDIFASDGSLHWAGAFVGLPSGEHTFLLPELVTGAYLIRIRTAEAQQGLMYIR